MSTQSAVSNAAVSNAAVLNAAVLNAWTRTRMGNCAVLIACLVQLPQCSSTRDGAADKGTLGSAGHPADDGTDAGADRGSSGSGSQAGHAAPDAAVAHERAGDGGAGRAADAGTARAGTSGSVVAGHSAGGTGGTAGGAPGSQHISLMQFSRLYSAYDGVHTFQLTPRVPRAELPSSDSDFIDASTLHWTVDDDFVSMEAYADAPDAVLLTTKKAGATFVRVSTTGANGQQLEDEVALAISRASDQQWQAGEMRYSHGMAVNWAIGAAPGTTGAVCVLPADTLMALPKQSDCAGCHSANSQLGVPVYTPEQTAGLSDDQLVVIFTLGSRPMGSTFVTPFLVNTAPENADCLYRSFHTWEIEDDVKIGMVWVLRSLQPKPLTH
jgi:hypothetical protein